MKTIIIPLLLCFALLIGCSNRESGELARLKQENTNLKSLLGAPPVSLDSLYPPIAPAPLYQIKMYELATPFMGFIMKVNEGDRKEAKALFDSFRDQYTATSKMVPQWKKDFPSDPIEGLAALIDQGDPGKVMEAVGKVGKVCHDCHTANMPKAQQKYHWPDFSPISVSDPATDRSLEFSQFMMSLDMSFVGMGIALQQGQIDKARKHFEDFQRGFGQLKETCQGCHDTERKYFVDADVNAFIRALGTALKSSSPDMKLIGELSEHIGIESCGKCHLVHIPATYAKERWKELDQSPN